MNNILERDFNMRKLLIYVTLILCAIIERSIVGINFDKPTKNVHHEVEDEVQEPFDRLAEARLDIDFHSDSVGHYKENIYQENNKPVISKLLYYNKNISIQRNISIFTTIRKNKGRPPNRQFFSLGTLTVATYNLWNVMFNWDIRIYRIVQMVRIYV